MRIPAPVVGICAALMLVLCFVSWQELVVVRTSPPDASALINPNRLRAFRANFNVPVGTQTVNIVTPSTGNGLVLTAAGVTSSNVGNNAWINLKINGNKYFGLNTGATSGNGTAGGMTTLFGDGIVANIGDVVSVEIQFVGSGGVTGTVTLMGYEF